MFFVTMTDVSSSVISGRESNFPFVFAQCDVDASQLRDRFVTS